MNIKVAWTSGLDYWSDRILRQCIINWNGIYQICEFKGGR